MANDDKVLSVNADQFLGWLMRTEEGQRLVPTLEEAQVARWQCRDEISGPTIASTCEEGRPEPNPVLDAFLQKVYSGGSHTAPEMRLMLYCLAAALRARDILETGYDAGSTTEVLAWTGARVVGVDDLSEYPGVDAEARGKMARYGNVELVLGDALEYLRNAPGGSFDLVFVDDGHDPAHVAEEARELRRVLRPGGVAVFHDTVQCALWGVLEEVFPDWQRVNLPAISPVAGTDYGMGIVRKPA